MSKRVRPKRRNLCCPARLRERQDTHLGPLDAAAFFFEGSLARNRSAISHKPQYGTRFEDFGKCSSRLMERRAGYSVKPAPQQASAGRRILANAWRGRGRDEQNYPASPRLDEEQLGAMLQIQAKRVAAPPGRGTIAGSAWSYIRSLRLLRPEGIRMMATH
jgi:hypothetical protein